MYEDPDTAYCYPGTDVLRNIADLRTLEALQGYELAMVSQRAEEPLPAGDFSTAHYRAVHQHLFQDVYEWAGRYRTVRISKGATAFCYPEFIDAEMEKLFGARNIPFAHVSPDDFASYAAGFLAELNAIHPFREGNGRTQNAFLQGISVAAGHPLSFAEVDKKAFLEAMIRSFAGDEQALAAQIRALID